jgi:hypothetical protein
MKNIILTLILGLFLQNAMTQVRVNPVFNSVHSGRSINLLASGQIKNRHEFGGGVRINIYKYAHNDDQNNLFKKRLYPSKSLHYFGLEGFYQVHILKNLKHIDLFAFYDIQVSYSSSGNRDLEYDDAGERPLRYYGPFTWLEQNIGIGFTVDIWKNIYLVQRLGVGTDFILGKFRSVGEDTRNNHSSKKFMNEFGYLLSVGIGYRFEQKK